MLRNAIAVANQKGGMGKTALTRELATLWAADGRTVLAVDCDPQFALTRQMGGRPAEPGLAEVLAGHQGPADVVQRLYGVDVLPSSPRLAGMETGLVQAEDRTEVLERAIADFAGGYDFVLFDAPPQMSVLTMNLLVACTIVLVPVASNDEGSVSGLANLRHTLAGLPGGRPLFTVITRWKRRENVHRSVLMTLEAMDAAPLACLAYNSEYEKAGIEREPVVVRTRQKATEATDELRVVATALQNELER